MDCSAKSKLALAALVIGVLGCQQMAAENITTVNLGSLSGSATNSGTFSNQAEVLEATFSLSSASSLTMYTTSYGGGKNLDGTTASAGGFQTMLTLYNSAGKYVMGEQVTSPIATKDPATGLALDAYLFDANLPAGSYIAVLTDWLNQQPPTATNLSDGFVDLGSGGSTFVDEQFNSRRATYALNLSAGSSAAAPEPATFWLVIPAAAVACLLRRKRKASAL
jgi:hypothetical protein